MMRGAGSEEEEGWRGRPARLRAAHPFPPPAPAARPGPTGGISGLGLIITCPSPGRRDPPARGARGRGRGGNETRLCAPGGEGELEEVAGLGHPTSRGATQHG